MPRRPVGPPYPFCPFGTFPLDKGDQPRNDRLFDRLGSPCGGAGTATAVTERAASLVKGRWHGEAVTEGFRPPESYPKTGIPQSASLTASPIPFVPSGHFPLIRGIGLAMTGFFDSLASPLGGVSSAHTGRRGPAALLGVLADKLADEFDLLLHALLGGAAIAPQPALRSVGTRSSRSSAEVNSACGILRFAANHAPFGAPRRWRGQVYGGFSADARRQTGG